MPRGARRLIATVAGALLCCTASYASAQVKVKPAFTRAYADAQDQYNLGHYDEARKLFEAARKAQDLAGPYRWLAQVAKVQERYEDCLVEAVGYLKKAATGKAAPEVRTMHESCRQALNRPRFRGEMSSGGAIAVTSNVEGATVRLNGLKYGATPMAPRAVAVGIVDVEITAQRYLKKAVVVDVIEGIVIDVRVDLEVDPNAKQDPGLTDPSKEVQVGWLIFAIATPNATFTLDGKTPTPDEKGRIEYATGTYEVIVEAAGHEPWRRRVRVVRGQERTLAIELREQTALEGYRRWGYVSLGVASAVAGAGIFFSKKEQSAREEAQDIWDIESKRQAPPLETFEDIVPIRTRQDIADAVDDAKKWRTLSAISFGAAAAALGVSIYFFVKERPAEREGFQLPIAITPLPDDHGGVAGVGATYTTELDW